MKNHLKQQLQKVCKKCYSVRKELHFDQLPEEMKKEIRGLNDQSLKFLNCERCNEISISCQIVSF